ncbi:MAG: aldehyde dehydrogenase [Rhodospirillaceae bacterium]|nr:aldehyde dehydrogenase [Rhodospirillaceae bacterium]|tara:strand:- start:4394 stop:4981 length:588 start_codon:yes stop_codon:yes gene_type:complete
MAISYKLQRRKVVHQILKERGDAAVITGIGNAVHDVASFNDDPKNMYLAGVMGGASMVAFGIALAQPKRRVLVITGDGELLAGVGSLATIGVEQPKNMSIIVIDNQAYGATGNQHTHTGSGVDLVGIAAASGFKKTALITTQAELESELPKIHSEPGPYFAVVKVTNKSSPRIDAPRDGTYVARRFRAAVTGESM